MSCFTPITSLPSTIDPSEHPSTPASFANTTVPPVLRHTQSQTTVIFDPPSIDHLSLSSEDLKDGTLYIIDSELVWFSPTKQRGFSLPYPNITLHAISRNGSNPCLYCQIDPTPVGTEDSAVLRDNPADDIEMMEMSLVPTNSDSLDSIFELLSTCASLHPDPATGSDEDDAFMDPSTAAQFEVFDGSQEQELSEVGRAALEHLESIIQYPDDVSRPDVGTSDDEQASEPHINGTSRS